MVEPLADRVAVHCIDQASLKPLVLPVQHDFLNLDIDWAGIADVF
jgi:hypothetical protein